MEITLRTDKSTAFKPLPKRWVVERSFAWLDDFRRLAKGYERKVTCSENMAHLADVKMIVGNIFMQTIKFHKQLCHKI